MARHRKSSTAGATDDRVKLLRLSRSYGKEVALTAGLDCAAGAAAVPMDVDLQDPPELIPEMMAKMARRR